MTGDIEKILGMSLQYIKGIGPARDKLFNSLGLYTVEDIIFHFPRDYEDRTVLKKISELSDGDSSSFEAIVSSNVIESRPRKGLSLIKARLSDETGTIFCVWFNQPYIKNTLIRGENYIFYGKASKKNMKLEMNNPVFEKLENKGEATCRIVPVYPSTAKLNQATLRKAIENALALVGGKLEETLPEWIRRDYKLSEYNYSVENIHFPKTDNDFYNARRRLVFDELFNLQLCLLSLKDNDREKKGISFAKVPELKALIESLPYKLTEAQQMVLNDILADMNSGKTMNRLVQGDVGSGKTIIAVLAMFNAVKNGYQAAMMVPTEILAKQHFESIQNILGKFGVKVALLVGSQTKKQKEAVLSDIDKGVTDILIGTHAVIEENVSFKKLGLVITDEQHRFGVRQRATLSNKAENPDVLVMTATPIPRTLALILYGDLDISIIDKLPPGRKPVKTYSVDEGMRERVNNFIKTKVSEGRQVYIVCPLVEESEGIDAKSALEHAQNIAAKDFRDLKVGLIYGKMKAKEKESIMSDFVKGDIDILVSTTVIEVGVNVPNASVMVIENAERFGLAQLHQLRGRVGRGVYQSYCILYNQGRSQIAKERMKVMTETNDGFIISEKDLQLRGPGEFFGTRQHGIPDLKIANLYRDMEILKQAQEAVLKLLKKDRMLMDPENQKLRKVLNEKLRKKLNGLTLN